MYRVIEHAETHTPVESLHPSYLDALLYLIERTYGYRRVNDRADIFFEDLTGRVLVKQYTHPARPSAEDVRSAVLHPERTEEFRIGPASIRKLCAHCGEYWPCTDSRRADIRPDLRARHGVKKFGGSRAS